MNADTTAKQVTVVLGTGGTIAGVAASPDDTVDYRAGQLGIAQLLAALPASLRSGLLLEQVAQIDSKDADFAFWRLLALRCEHWLAQPRVRALVLTHGTDTIEETACFLSRVLPAAKPVVLTCAMRPATAAVPDGPGNLRDALVLAADPSAHGVLVACAGEVHGALEVQKVHAQRLNPFSSGAAGPLARFEAGVPHWLRAAAPAPMPALRLSAASLPEKPQDWPPVEIVLSHAGASGRMVRALVQAGVRGIVAAGTGNGTLHEQLEQALLEAQAGGVRVVRASRCAEGGMLPRAQDAFETCAELPPAKARITLLLDLLAQQQQRGGAS